MALQDINIDEVKRKIRKLKKLEIKIRFGNTPFIDEKSLCSTINRTDLIWDEFFHLQSDYRKNVKYTLRELARMDKEEFKNVIAEFFFHVYYRYYKENGIVSTHVYNPEMLAQMGLAYDADSSAVKKKFRELAKKYHPDTGGDSTKFIAMMENYKKLID